MRRRVGLLAALAVLAAVGLYRVFAPAETVSGVTGPLPPPPTRGPGVVGTLPWMPLFVDGRLRVYADGRRVHADGPIDFRVQTTPYWSFRRWPATVDGLVASNGAVFSHWSDGQVVALDASTGGVRWQASGPPGAVLHAAGDLAIAVAPGEVRAYRSSDGALAWWVAVPGCAGPSFAASGGLVGLPCGGETRLIDTAVGEARATLFGVGAVPLGCGAARSGCGGVRIAGRAWVLDGPTPAESPTLAATGAWLAGAVAVDQAGAAIVGRDARTGAERWRTVVAGRILATQPGRVHVLTPHRELVTLDAATGAERSRFRYVADDDAVDWEPGLSYAADGFVTTERVHTPEYPYPVILAAT